MKAQLKIVPKMACRETRESALAKAIAFIQATLGRGEHVTQAKVAKHLGRSTGWLQIPAVKEALKTAGLVSAGGRDGGYTIWNPNQQVRTSLSKSPETWPELSEPEQLVWDAMGDIGLSAYRRLNEQKAHLLSETFLTGLLYR